MNPSTPLVDAFEFASRYHQGQTKKGTNYPYLYHPMAVASLALKFGGTNEQAAAALLHDTIADGKISEKEITDRFGTEVSQLVFGFADPELPEGAGWRGAKQAYLNKVKGLSEGNVFVAACEELHDSSELLHDLRYQGSEVWKRYPVHGMEVFWYYRELLAIFTQRLSAPKYRALVGEFASTLKSLRGIIFEGASY